MKRCISLVWALSLTSLANAAIFTVTNTNDALAGSLRQAIIDANASADPTNTVLFNIPGAGPHTITLLSGPLPSITANGTTIDGFSQPGWSADNPVIVIDCNTFLGLQIYDASNCTIQGLVISNSLSYGILLLNDGVAAVDNNAIYGCFIGTDQTGTIATGALNAYGIQLDNQGTSMANTIIGGTGTGQGNLISGNTALFVGMGINIFFDGGALINTSIVGNRIGTDKAGTGALPNNIGIFLQGGLASGEITGTIGGSTSAARNIISGNLDNGILMQNVDTWTIQGNFIGTDSTGTNALGNGSNGLFIDSSSSIVIGGTTSGQGNVIASNGQDGIFTNVSIDNSIQGNFIGTDLTATLALGNTVNGIQLTSQSDNNLIGGLTASAQNAIANNGQFGVSVESNSDLNQILRNSIFDNGIRGIQLIANGNNEQPAPLILGASESGNMITVTAQAPVLPTLSTFRLEFFISDNTGNPANTEGKIFLGAIDPVASGAVVTQTFTGPGSTAGDYITATATNHNNAGNTLGDTSEFSNNSIIQASATGTCPTVTLSASPSTIPAGGSTVLTATITGGCTPTHDLLWSDGFIQRGVTSPVSRTVTPAFSTTYSAAVTTPLPSVTVTVNQVESLIVTAILAKYPCMSATS